MNRRLIIFPLLICWMVLLAGCWDHVEIEDLAIVRSVGIDYFPGQKAPYVVTLAVASPGAAAGGGDGGGGAGGGGGARPPKEFYSGAGASVDLAMIEAGRSLTRKLFLSHAEIFIVSEDLAASGLQHVLDFIMRNHEARLTAYLLVADGFAQDILKTPPILETGVTEEILGIIEHTKITGEIFPQRAFEFVRTMARPGQDSYTAVIKAVPALEEIKRQKNEQGEKPAGNGAGEQGGGSGGQETQKKLIFSDMAVFHGDRMAGRLNPSEARGYLRLAGEVRFSTMVVTDPREPEKNVSLWVNRSNTVITPQLKNGAPSFRVKVEEEGDIRSQESTTNLSTVEMIKKLNSAKAGVIKAEMEKALRRMQELEADVVGFGAILSRKEPGYYREVSDRWPEIFRELQVDITVKAHIRRTGQHSGPARPRR